MTVLDILQTYTLEEILENDEIVLFLEKLVSTRNCDFFSSNHCAFEQSKWFRADACGIIDCQYYDDQYDQYDNTLWGNCNIVEEYANKNGVDPSHDYIAYEKFAKQVRCPYKDEHVKFVKNTVKEFLLKELAE